MTLHSLNNKYNTKSTQSKFNSTQNLQVLSQVDAKTLSNILLDNILEIWENEKSSFFIFYRKKI